MVQWGPGDQVYAFLGKDVPGGPARWLLRILMTDVALLASSPFQGL
jgi:hypothetical protein